MRRVALMALSVVAATGPMATGEPVDGGHRSGERGSEAFHHEWAAGVPFESPEATVVSVEVRADLSVDGDIDYRMHWRRTDCDQESCIERDDWAARVSVDLWSFDFEARRIDADVIGSWEDGSTCRVLIGFDVGDTEVGQRRPAFYLLHEGSLPSIAVQAGVGERLRDLRYADHPDTLSTCERLPDGLAWKRGLAMKDTGHHTEVYAGSDLS